MERLKITFDIELKLRGNTQDWNRSVLDLCS